MIGFNNVNKVVLVGRLFRDPEVRTFGGGGKVAKLKMVVSNRGKNKDTGEWEDRPVFLDVEVYNRGEYGKDADHCEQRLHNKDVVYVEGRLEMDQWEKDGQKHSKVKVVADAVVFLTQGRDGGGGESGPRREGSGYEAPADDGDDVPF